GYVLTVSVSISSGVAQIVSALPALFEFRVEIALFMVALVVVLNLRGVRESGLAFAIPAYLFLGSTLLTIGIGLARAAIGTLGTVTNPPEIYSSYDAIQLVTPFLLLHAFSSGTSALTGIEAIANGVTAFKAPSARNAGIVLIWMGSILAVLFIGITYLARITGSVPSEAETVISQLTRTVYGGEGLPYIVVVTMTSVILILAANTAFAGFPRLAAILARDGFLPRQLAFRGSRLVFSRGIVALGVLAGLLIVFFDASVARLIPLYAIGVFLSFTLSQIGMARRWWKVSRLAPGQEVVESEHSAPLRYDRNYLGKLLVNAAGALSTGVVTLVFGITNFLGGAWIVVALVPMMVVAFSGIQRHYHNLARQLSLDHFHTPNRLVRYRVIVPISGVHQGTLSALRHARSFSNDVTAVFVSMTPEDEKKIQEKWSIFGEGVRLLILQSPYRLLLEPILEYIESLLRICQKNEAVLVVVPQFVSRRWWTSILHNQTAFMLRMALLTRPGVVIIEVPYQVE
ncbi:MAG TPA: amino acid permease, partial [Anaerolineaceae bacterium]